MSMKRFLLSLLVLLVTAASVMAQGDGKTVRRLRIRHADPALIMLLLTGRANFSTPPEISTIINAPGGSGGNGGFGNSGFGGGGSLSGGNGGFGNGGYGGGGGR